MAVSKEEKSKIIKQFAINEKDTGSVEVQIACLTHNINALTEHCKKHKKDFSTKRGLLKMVCRRTSFLRYLAAQNIEKYKTIIGQLGLRK
jgi:small subunit ribosomal protein S15